MSASSSASDVAELAKCHTEAAIAALAVALNVPMERVPAAIALLTIGWGQPTLPIAVDTHGLVVEFRDGQPPPRANGEDADECGHYVGKLVA